MVAVGVPVAVGVVIAVDIAVAVNISIAVVGKGVTLTDMPVGVAEATHATNIITRAAAMLKHNHVGC
jgi:hypothetical protein